MACEADRFGERTKREDSIADVKINFHASRRLMKNVVMITVAVSTPTKGKILAFTI